MIAVLPKYKEKIIKATNEYNSTRVAIPDASEESKYFRSKEPFFLPYQKYVWQAIEINQCTVIEKSRRIGVSWLLAGWAAMEAAKNDGSDIYYFGYNHSMTETFISDIGWFAKAYNLVASSINCKVIHSEGKSILAFRVRFTSGFKVVALSSKPANLRSRKGHVILDEAAFMEDLEEVLKAGLAALIWGYKVIINSTHNGIENPFNKLLQRIRDKELPYKRIRITFMQAVLEGLCKRIFKVKRQKWTPEVQDQWIKEQYAFYGIGAAEELDVIPSDVKGGGMIYRREYFGIIEELPQYFDAIVRAWDLAGTDRRINENSFYTCGVLVGVWRQHDRTIYIVLDMIAQQLSTTDSDDLIISTAIRDNSEWGDRLAYFYGVPVRWEQEPADAGQRVTVYLRDRLSSFDADGVKAIGSKVARARPCADDASRGLIYLWSGSPSWHPMFKDNIHAFDGTPKPLVNDIADSLALAHACLRDGIINPMLGT